MFSFPDELEKHVREHPKKPLQCDKCNEIFTRKSHLKMHVRIHKEESFSCKICRKVLKKSFLEESHEKA